MCRLVTRTKLLIFGDAKAGTPLMRATPSVAIALPLKLLVAEHTDGSVAVSWNDPEWLQQRHGFENGAYGQPRRS